jgi:SAM-dependent methyltransferase
MGAVEDYAGLIDAVDSQLERLQGPPLEDRWGGTIAKRFRADPKREMEDNFEVMAAFVRPGDVFVDVGGGAGRLSLPMALRCKQVINVEPSLGMGQEFQALAQEFGIENADFVESGWLESEGIQGDVVHAANVTYFVRDIGRFAEKLDAAARRRVIIGMWSIPNPMHNAKLFKMVYGEEQAAVPGHSQLLPALWELGILPDVRFLPDVTAFGGVIQPPSYSKTKEDAVESALSGVWLAPHHRDRGEVVVREHFDELFEEAPDGFVPIWLPNAQPMLITWETGDSG